MIEWSAKKQNKLYFCRKKDMSISDKVRKELWAKSGNRCAIWGNESHLILSPLRMVKKKRISILMLQISIMEQKFRTQESRRIMRNGK